MIVFRAVMLVLLLGAVAEADIYKYVGDDGAVLYTDAPLGKKNEKITIEGNVSNRPKAYKTKGIISNKKQRNNYNLIVNKKAKEHEIDPFLVTAVIKAESNGNPYAISRKGAIGLMQLMPTTANELQIRNLFDPEENIDGGTRYLKYLLDRFNGNLTLALAAYNAGPKAVEKHGSVPPISETKQYVKKVLSLYKVNQDSSSGSYKIKKAEPIYKIIMEDGTILFTNFPISKAKTNLIRF